MSLISDERKAIENIPPVLLVSFALINLSNNQRLLALKENETIRARIRH